MSDVKNPRQFKHLYDADYDPENLGPSDPAKHRIHKVPIEDIRAGDVVKPTWGNFPFERARADAYHDIDHPSDDSANEEENDADGRGTIKMYTVPYARRFSPHQPNGTDYFRRVDRQP